MNNEYPELDFGKQPEPEQEVCYTPEPEQSQAEPPRYTTPVRQPVPARPQPTQRVRRVGSFSMGLALIVFGILLLLFLFTRNYNIPLTAAKWSPLLLVALGAEILLSNVLFRKDKLKYDFLSVLFTLFLLGSSMVIASIPVFYEFGPQRRMAEESISQEIRSQYYDTLKGTPEISALNVRVSLYGVDKEIPKNARELRAGDSVYTSIELLDNSETPQAFAARCKPLIDKLKFSQAYTETIHFSSIPADGQNVRTYDLTVNDRFQADMTAETLSSLVSTTEPELDA